MKKKLLIIPVMLLATLCLAFLPGCGGPSAKEAVTSDLTYQLDKVKNCDDDFTEVLTDSVPSSQFSRLGLDPVDFAKAFLDGFEYEIKDVTVDEDAGTATAKVDVTCKSMNAIVSDFNQEFSTQATENAGKSMDELYKLGGEILMQSTKDCATQTTECSFEYERNSAGNWEARDGAENDIISAMS